MTDRMITDRMTRSRRLSAKLALIVVVGGLLGPIPKTAPANASLQVQGNRGSNPAVEAQTVSARQVSAGARHTVSQGQTLWGIAVKYFPASDPRCAVESIRRANPEAEGSLAVGTVLAIPDAADCG